MAAAPDVGQVSDVTKVVDPDTFQHPIYAGNEIATVQSLDDVKVITVRTTAFDPAAEGRGAATVERVVPVARNGRRSSWAARSRKATGEN